MPRLYRLAAIYLAVQATATVAWWLLLWLVPRAREPFRFGGSDDTLLAFWLPDLLLLAGGSALASFLCLRRREYLPPVLWLTAGGIIYATLYCLAASLRTGTGWLGFLLMAPAALVTAVLAAGLHPDAHTLFRLARPAAIRYNLLKTFTQIVLFWSALLFLFPLLLVRLQQQVGMPLIAFPGQRPLSALMFVAFSAFGLWSGITMARWGEGTPLPLDATRRLVVSGPYARVRNPMAVAGLGQGLAVALFTGSAVVVGYALLGALLWQYVVRPLEEEDLLRRFGAEYESYRASVGCWVPARRGTRPGPPPPQVSG